MSECLQCNQEIVGRRSDVLYCSKRCSAAAANARYWETERAREVRERWLSTEEGRQSRERYYKSKKFIEGTTVRMRHWRARHPEKWEAHKAVKRAVTAGLLVKPIVCEGCQQVRKLEGHHADYSLPLDVEWLCRRCHQEVHYA